LAAESYIFSEGNSYRKDTPLFIEAIFHFFLRDCSHSTEIQSEGVEVAGIPTKNEGSRIISSPARISENLCLKGITDQDGAIERIKGHNGTSFRAGHSLAS
jgi:hypothetical protein